MGSLDEQVKRHMEREELHRLGVRKDPSGTIYLHGRMNLIEGTGISITVGEDEAKDETTVTLATGAGAGGGYAMAFEFAATDAAAGYAAAVDLNLPSTVRMGFTPSGGVLTVVATTSGGSFDVRVKGPGAADMIAEVTGLSGTPARGTDATLDGAAWPTTDDEAYSIEVKGPGGSNTITGRLVLLAQP